MKWKGVDAHEVTLIRPFGCSNVPREPLEEANAKKCFFQTRQGLQSDYVMPRVQQHNIDLAVLLWRYGGPRTLAQYKCYVLFPYQPSMMKMSENFAGKETFLSRSFPVLMKFV